MLICRGIHLASNSDSAESSASGRHAGQRQTGGQRFATMLLTSFAAAGLVLAIVGIYGVVSFLVAQRKQELAVRIALGASRANVLWLVLKQGLEMAALGAAIGLFGAWTREPSLAALSQSGSETLLCVVSASKHSVESRKHAALFGSI